MPMRAKLQVYVEDCLDEETLSCLRAELLRQYDEDEFCYQTPLEPVDREDYELAGLEGAPGHLSCLNVSQPYYGLGYERGYLPLFMGLAEWLEQRLPGCRIFYSEDSTGESFPFDTSARDNQSLGIAVLYLPFRLALLASAQLFVLWWRY